MSNRVPCEPLVEAVAILIHRSRHPPPYRPLSGIAHLGRSDQRALHDQARRLLADAAACGVTIELAAE